MLTRTQQFLSDHPVCCFCGGEAPSEEEDHIPGRDFFKGRHWPEGYSFPACKDCNASTRHDEMLVNVFSRALPLEDSEEQAAEFKRVLTGLKNNFPHILAALQPRANEVRAIIKALGVQRLPGQFLSEMPFLSADHDAVQVSLGRYGLKLGCALFYKHLARLLPKEAGVLVKWQTNVRLSLDGLPEGLVSLTGVPGMLNRGKSILNDQFQYRYGLQDDGNAAVFFIGFRLSLYYSLTCVNDVRQLPEFPPEVRVWRPRDLQKPHLTPAMQR